jgi:hypothetical protein
MAAGRYDWDILWIVLLAVVGWVAFWHHAEVAAWMYSAWVHKSLLF